MHGTFFILMTIYQLAVNAFTGEKKADAPLDILGSWNVTFTVE